MPNQTGPNTRNGKKRSSRNAVRHGILARVPILGEGLEDPHEWEQHLQGLIDSWKPATYQESILVDRLAIIYWRLKRVDQYEVDLAVKNVWDRGEYRILMTQLSDAIKKREEPTPVTPEELERDGRTEFVASGSDLADIQRYETHLHRMSIQIIHELEALQTRRAGGQVNLARLDISGSPA